MRDWAMSWLSNWHWLIVIVAWILWIVPLYKILGRVGIAKGWAFVALFPPFGMIVLWTIAFSRWRIADANEGAGLPV